MEKIKKKLIILSIIAALLIIAVVIALLCIGKPAGESVPEQTEPTFVDPTVPSTGGSTTSPTKAPTDPTDPTENTAPSATTEPAETVDPSAPTAPTKATEPSAPATNPTAQPSQPTKQPTKPATQPPTKAPTAPTAKPTQPSTQPTNSPNVLQLKINTEEYTGVLLGNTLQLDYTYTGKKPLTWTSDNPSVITVDKKGVVKGISAGTAMITVTDGQVQASVILFADSFVINTPSGLVLSVGEKLQLDYEILDDTGVFGWSSSDTSVLTVDNNGVVTGVGTGLASVTATDGWRRLSIYIYVVADEDRTVAFDLQVDCPLYDGVTKFVGHYLQINHLNSHTRNARGQWSGIINNWTASGSHTDPSTPDPKYPNRNYYITSSNPNVVSVVNQFDEGFYDDFLYFNKPGKSVITVTSWDGYSESYTIYVKAEYDCAPKKEKLTPGEFAYYATMVGVEDGQVPGYQIRSYLYIWYSEDELTWENAKGLGHANAKREFYLQNEDTMIVYAGFDESNGKHLFYHGMGESPAQIEPYTPAASSTGKIRFPSKSINIMEKTLKVVEVLGNTRDELVVYTSSNPSIVEASGSMLIAKHPGTAVITATYKGQTATMTVNVTMDPSIERIIFEQDTYTIPLHDAMKLNYTYNGTSKLKWESSNESIARIDSAGTLVAEGEGECTIWLRSVDEYFVVGSCKVIVTAPIDYPDATDIKFRDTSDKLRDGMQVRSGTVLTLDVYTVPTDSWTEVMCESSNYDTASVNFSWDPDLGRTVYKVVCQSAGTVTITLTSSDGCVSRDYTIIVKER